MALQAILIAGGRLPRQLHPHSDSAIKALLPVGGETLLARCAHAALERGEFETVCAVGGAEVKLAAQELGIAYAPEGPSVMDNIHSAFKQLGEEDSDYVIISPDLPFISAGGLRAFIAGAGAGAELAVPLITREDFLSSFPGAPNRFERIDGRQVTMGSVFYLTGPVLRANIPLGRDFFSARKWPHRMATLLGFNILLAFLFGRLTLAGLERRAQALTGAVVRAVEVDDAGLAYDIDNLANYEFACALLERESQRHD